jgi:hypothetical protein
MAEEVSAVWTFLQLRVYSGVALRTENLTLPSKEEECEKSPDEGCDESCCYQPVDGWE